MNYEFSQLLSKQAEGVALCDSLNYFYSMKTSDNFILSIHFGIILLMVTLFTSCAEEKNCPGFPEKLSAYIPQENRLMFYNAAGDSLLFTTDEYMKTEAHTAKRNVWSVGGSGSAPYCTSSCGMSTSLLSSNANQISYTISVDHETDTCAINISIVSALITNDYFFQSAALNGELLAFGDTLSLETFTATTNPRFSRAVIVYGRGIIALQDDLVGCLWSR
jgi:hypothetical protein